MTNHEFDEMDAAMMADYALPADRQNRPKVNFKTRLERAECDHPRLEQSLYYKKTWWEVCSSCGMIQQRIYYPNQGYGPLNPWTYLEELS